jgi:hypothetical protein
VSASVAYGSGFLEGDGLDHKPAHATVNLQATKTLGKQWTLLVTALNVGDTHFLLDESNTFGGTPFQQPATSIGGREVSVPLQRLGSKTRRLSNFRSRRER